MTNKQKKILITSIIIFVVILGIIAGIVVSKKSSKKIYPKTQASQIENDKSIDTLTDVQKEIAGIAPNKVKENEIKKEDYSKAYKEFKDHLKEDKGEVIPRKNNVPFEKLDEIKKLQDEQNIDNNKTNNNNNNNNSDKNKQDDTDTIQKDQDDKGKIDNDTTDNDTTDNNGLPKYFNLADKIDIKVEHQGTFGLCWDFASIKALETHLALNNLGNYDLSEIHLDYIESNLLYGYRDVHTGGNFSNFQSYVTESGVVLEEDAPYREHSENEYYKFVDTKNVVNVTETVNFPSMSKYDYDNHTEEEFAEFREVVKKHIMTNGGLYCCIATPDFGTKYFNWSTSSECFLGSWDDLSHGREFHAVTIVGWDDNYSKDNFNSDMRPTKDGAYIALNSWGTAYGNKGYYYISYEDKYVENDLSGIISTSLDHAYKLSDIKNPVIQDYLRNRYGYLLIKHDGEEYITKSVISNIYSLDLSNTNLTSLDGIEIFQDTYEFILSNNHIKDLTPLTKLTTVSSIDLSNNDITDLSPLANLKSTSMNSINLSNNKLKDVSPLSNIKYEYALNINLSKNPGITGYDTLTNATMLDVSNCNITDVGSFKNCNNLVELAINNTNGLKNLTELPASVNNLYISNCGISTLPILTNKLISLDISKNKITSLEGIQTYKNLNSLNISENSITDWGALRGFVKENSLADDEFEYDYEEYWDGLYISANNCNIADITIFNDLEVQTFLELQNNKIKDVSNFNNENVSSIDLSNNPNITGLEGLSKINTIFLNNCNINDIEEIIKLKNVSDLSLENNQLTDISKLSELEYLYTISLAGNKGLRGYLRSDSISILNVSNCDLDDSFNFSELTDLFFLNISQNANIKDIMRIYDHNTNESLNIIADNIDFDILEKINTKYHDRYYYINNAILNLDYELKDNETQLNLKDKKALRSELMHSIHYGLVNVVNGDLNKNGYLIDIDDTSVDSVELHFLGWGSNLDNSVIKINLHPNDEDTTIDTTNEISVDNKTNTTNTTNTINNITNTNINEFDNSVTNETTRITDTTENTITNNVDDDNTNENTANTIVDNTIEDNQNIVNDI